MPPELPVTKLPFPPPQTRVITRRDTLPEAIRKALLGQLQIMLAQEETARLGADIEGVHQMRVATRRIRSLYKSFGDLLDARYTTDIPDHLKHTARTLGAVRDLDVFMANTRQYMGKKRGDERASLEALLEVLRAQHQQARADLIAWLDGDAYLRFVFSFFDVLKHNATTTHLPQQTAPEKPLSYEVRHVLPGILYEQYRKVRQFETVLPSSDVPTLHSLRIHAKQLRYSLDAFRDVLGRPANGVIGQVKVLQSYLGELNDASVAAARLDTLRAQHPSLSNAAIEAYRSHYAARCKQYIAGFPPIWARFDRYKLRRSLALALANC